jgi:hypothetical protein
VKPDRERRCALSVPCVGALAAGIAAVVVLLRPCNSSADEPAGNPTCTLRLSVEVTPDVPNPSDGGFLSSLLDNHPGYELFVLRTVDDTHVDLQLHGPGFSENCEQVVDSMRNDGRVLSIKVQQEK